MIYSKIIGTGSYLPERIMTNTELESRVDTSDAWIQAGTGIKQRHIAAENETTSDMAMHAINEALECARIDTDKIDLIIVATSTPDLIYPSTACIVQKKMGLHNGCPAFDIQAVCSGFIYALTVADKFIRSGTTRRALIIGADMNSRILDWTDRGTCVLFGDGAGAVILEASEQPGIYASRLHADGAYADLLEVPSGVSDRRGEPFIKMRGNEVFKFAVNVMGDIVDEILEAAGKSREDIDWLVSHQANQRIISATAKKLNFDMDRVIMTVAEHGNTSGASIPLALDSGIRTGQIKRGEVLLFEAVGGGFTWGAALVKY